MQSCHELFITQHGKCTNCHHIDDRVEAHEQDGARKKQVT